MAQEQEWQTLSGTVENIVYCNEENGYTVLEFSSGGDLYTAVGELSDVNVGEDVTLHGRFVTHPSFGEQFRVEACEVRMPESATAIRRYLASGALPYIGKALAGRIVDVFGADALEVIASDPMALTKIKGITPEKALAASNEFKRICGVREARCSASTGLIRSRSSPTLRTCCAGIPLIRISAWRTPLPRA